MDSLSRGSLHLTSEASIHSGNFVTVHGEEDYAVYKAPAIPYVGVNN